MMPRDGPISRGLQKEYEKLLRKHGDQSIIPLHLEHGVYNFYIKQHKSPEAHPGSGEKAKDMSANEPQLSGGSRQA